MREFESIKRKITSLKKQEECRDTRTEATKGLL